MAEEILLKLKAKSIEKGISEPRSYAPSMHFFHAKPLIDKDPIFKIIQRVPKGAVLHLHNSAGVSSEWVIKNLTYRDDMKLCSTKEGIKVFETMWDFNIFGKSEFSAVIYSNLVNQNYAKTSP